MRGFETDLHLQGQEFATLLSILYVGYILMQIPSSLTLRRVVDLHSHLAIESSPVLDGSTDGNSYKGPIVPWLRALDGLNTHDDGK